MPRATLTHLSCSQTSRMLQILMNECWHMNQLLIIIKLAWDHFNLKMLFLTLWTRHQYAYSPYCSLYISKGADKENFSNNQDLLYLVIISFILMALICDSGVISWEEIRCWSLLGVKGSMIQQPSTCLLSYRNITDKKWQTWDCNTTSTTWTLEQQLNQLFQQLLSLFT